MSYFECFSVTVWTIFCFNPKLRLFFVRNWILLYINENANRYAKLTRSSYYRFTFLCLSFENLVQNNRILLKYYGYQVTRRCLEGRLEGLKISSWFMKLVEYRIAKKFQEFPHYCRSLHHRPYSRGCQVRFYLMKQSFILTT